MTDYLKFGTREHRGGLKESLETTKYISFEEFKNLLPEYEPYAYDPRTGETLFLIKNMELNFKKHRDWLFIQNNKY